MATRSEGARAPNNLVAASRTTVVSSMDMCTSSNSTATNRCGNFLAAACASSGVTAASSLAVHRGGRPEGLGFGSFRAEIGDRLRLAVVEELKIFPAQVGDDFALVVAHDHAHQH